MPKGHLALFFIITTVFIASAAAVVHPRGAGLRRRRPVKPLRAPKPFVAEYNWEQQLYVKAHNDLRLQEGMPLLSWSANLTTEAYNWAYQRRRDCNYRRHSPNIYGENIYWKSYNEFTPEEVVQKWYDEKKLYDHVNNVCLCSPERDGCECGHYLNVIWSTTMNVGCSGPVYCTKQRGVLVVCQYDPPGLIQGINPFTGGRKAQRPKGAGRKGRRPKGAGRKAWRPKSPKP